MFTITNNFKTANNVLNLKLKKIKNKGYSVYKHKHNLSGKYSIEKIVIKAKKKTKNRLVFSSGLHGVEGYVGHAAIHAFLDSIIDTLSEDTEIIIYPTLNPYGMETYQRTNTENIDLNRNFSKTNFTLDNSGYSLVQSFIEPKEFRNGTVFNSSFYFELSKLMTKHGIKSLYKAFLFGQNNHQEGICFTGTKFAEESIYIMDEFANFLKTKIPLTWIDLHSGYGPVKQMSVINSKTDVNTTLEMIQQCDYPYILGTNEDDIYDTDGDIIDKFYEIKNQKYPKSDFYGTCFEFGTTGMGTVKSMEALKSIIAMNHARHTKSKTKFKAYATKIMKKQFAPKGEKWRKKAYNDFVKATNEIIKYRKLV